MENRELLYIPEMKPSVEELIHYGEEALSGAFDGDTAEMDEATPTGVTLPGGFELGDGPILDMNDKR
jgi:hypothetical protein